MATSWWFHEAAADFAPDTIRTHRSLTTSRGPAEVTDSRGTQNGPIGAAGIDMTDNPGTFKEISWWTPTLNAFTLSGTVTMKLYMIESATTANAGAEISLYRTDSSGNIISTVAQNEKGTELPTTYGINGQSWTFTPTSTTFAGGDRLLAIVAFNDAGGNMSSGKTVTFAYDRATNGEGDSFFTLTEDVTLFSGSFFHDLPIMGVGA